MYPIRDSSEEDFQQWRPHRGLGFGRCGIWRLYGYIGLYRGRVICSFVGDDFQSVAPCAWRLSVW